jgi:acid phosphatase (class A)
MFDPEFPKENWWPWTYAQLGLVKLLENGKWREVVVPPPPRPESAAAVWESEQLLALQADRAQDQIDEIVHQDTNKPFDRFGAIVGATAVTHPRTFALMQAMIPVGLATSMIHKARFNRARPTQVIPGLTSVLTPVPGHPSYPSGHAQQAHMVAAAIIEAASPPPAERQALLDFAWAIAGNREIAGVHFRSDSIAGRDLAAALRPHVFEVYADLLEEARAEWASHVWPQPAPMPGGAPTKGLIPDAGPSRWTDGPQGWSAGEG